MGRRKNSRNLKQDVVDYTTLLYSILGGDLMARTESNMGLEMLFIDNNPLCHLTLYLTDASGTPLFCVLFDSFLISRVCLNVIFALVCFFSRVNRLLIRKQARVPAGLF